MKSLLYFYIIHLIHYISIYLYNNRRLRTSTSLPSSNSRVNGSSEVDRQGASNQSTRARMRSGNTNSRAASQNVHLDKHSSSSVAKHHSTRHGDSKKSTASSSTPRTTPCNVTCMKSSIEGEMLISKQIVSAKESDLPNSKWHPARLVKSEELKLKAPLGAAGLWIQWEDGSGKADQVLFVSESQICLGSTGCCLLDFFGFGSQLDVWMSDPWKKAPSRSSSSSQFT